MKIKWDKKEIGRITMLLSFFLPIVIMMTIFVGKKVYPFGDRSFLTADLYHQYMPFFTEFWDKLHSGRGLDFSWNVGIGSNFLVLYAYYLASPFHFVGILFPKSHLIEFVTYMVVFKFGLTGLTSYIYFRFREAKKHQDGVIPLFLSLLYALSGFMAAYDYNIMWLDCILILPLILLGLERLVKEGKGTLYCVALGFSIYTNFYLSIMICMFLVLYFGVLLINNKFDYKTLAKFTGFSLLSGGLAGALLIPSVRALMATDFGDFAWPEKWKSYFSILDIVARHCAGVTVERGLAHWPNIYCGAIVFLLLPLFFMNEKLSVKERFSKLFLVGFFLLSFGTNYLEFIWHGFNFPDSLPARQSFIYIMVILTICQQVLVGVKEYETNKLMKAYLAAIGFLLLAEKVSQNDLFKAWTVALNLGLVTIYALLLYFKINSQKKHIQLVIAIMALFVVIGESSFNMVQTCCSTSERAAFLRNQEEYKELAETARAEKEGFFRIEKFTRKTKNDGVRYDYPSATVFSSTMNSKVMDLYHQLGMRYSKVYYCYEGASPLVSALLNISYMMETDKDYANSLYEIEKNSGNVYLYKCKADLPFGYVAPKGYDLQTDLDNPIEIQNEMVRELGINEALFEQRETEQEKDNVRFTAYEDGIYFGMVTAGGTKTINVSGSTPDSQKHTNLKKNELIYLGSMVAEQSVLLSNGDDADDSKKITVAVYRLNEETLRQAIDKLSKQHMDNVVYTDTTLEGRLKLQTGGRLIMSVPAEEGWALTLNGEKTEYETFGEAFIALDLEPGEYNIALKYAPAGRGKGILLSLVSLLVFGWIYVKENDIKLKFERKNKKESSKIA